MTNLEERLAEINRRSEIIFQKRKRRKHMILTCVPILLCVGIVSAFIGSENARPQGEGEENAWFYGDGSSGGWDDERPEIGTEYIEKILIEVTADDAQQMEDMIRKMIMGSQLESSGSDMTVDTPMDGELRTVYQIRIVRSDHVNVSYELWGNQLTDTENEKSYTITRQQRLALLEALECCTAN